MSTWDSPEEAPTIFGGSEKMYMSDEQILRRIRRQLAQLNIRVHKVVALDGPRYVPYSEADPTDRGAPLTLNGLIDFAERMAERHREFLLS